MEREIWIGGIEVRQLPNDDPKIKLAGVGAFTWVAWWAYDNKSFTAKISEVMRGYDLFVGDQEKVMPLSEAEEAGLVNEELAEQAEDARKNENFCIYGTFYSYKSDN